MPDRNNGYSRIQVCSIEVFILIFVFGLAIFGCQSENNTSDVKLDWELKPDPPKVGMATLNITLRDSTNQLITDADIKLEGNMSHPGMEPVLTTAQEVTPGQYSAEIEFTMGGDWFFLINATLPDDRVLERQINIPGVRSE